MSESTRPKLNRFRYAAMLLGALALWPYRSRIAAIATAERVWDIEKYDYAWKVEDGVSEGEINAGLNQRKQKVLRI